MKPLSSPISVFIAITDKCNLNCKHCNVASSLNRGNELTFNEWKELFDHLVDIKTLKVWISGGEPFMRKDLFDLLDHISGKPLYIDGLNTNATLIDRDKAKKLAAYRKLRQVQVSVDGSCSAVHDRLRGKGAFEGMMRGVDNLNRAGIHTYAFTTVNKFNLKDLEKTVRTVVDSGLSFIRFTPLLVLGNADRFSGEIALSRKELIGAVEETARLKRKYGKEIIGGVLAEMGDSYSDMQRYEEMIPSEGPVSNFTGCKATLQRCTVRPDGYVVPCDRLWHLKAGNIRESTFSDIWNSSPVFREFRQRFSMTIDRIEECRDCKYNRVCTGGCPASAYHRNKELFDLDPLSCHRYLKEDIFGEDDDKA
jgi:SynChlorMet cassette radical SAM/SPASM protein ScmE